MLHGQVRYNIASRFLNELPAGTVQWLSPKGRDGTRGERDDVRVGRARIGGAAGAGASGRA